MIGELGKVPDERWQEALRHSAASRGVIRWLPVVHLDECRVELGLSENGYWVRHAGNTVMEFSEGEPLVFLLPCLEISLPELRAKLAAALSEGDLPLSFLDRFPFLDLMLAGAKSGSAESVPLSLGWMEEYPLCPVVAAALDTLLHDNPGLRLPKRVWNYVRNWRQSQGKDR